jgi:hypothetical protein
MTRVPYTFGIESSPIPLSQLDANFAVTPQYASAAGNVVNPLQANITAVGTLVALSVAGNINSGNLRTRGSVSTTGNVIAGSIFASGLFSAFGNVTGGGFITAGRITSGNSITASGNITGNNFNTVGQVSATGNIRGGNIATVGQFSATGNIATQGIVSATGNIVTDEYFVGNFLGNITGNLSVGGSNTQVLFNLNGNVGAAGGLTYNKDSNTLSVLGAISATASVSVGGQASVAGNVTGGNLIVNGTSQLIGVATAPTAPVGTANNQVASTAFVNNAVTIATASLGTMSTQNANNVSISGGNITGLTTALAITDGGTGARTLTRDAVIIGNGVGSLNFVSPGTAGNILTDTGNTWVSQAPVPQQSIGSTWTDVTGIRGQGIVYTNTTGKFIQVSGNFGCNGGGQGFIYINGTLISFWQAQFNGCGGYSVNMPCLIPPGATYMLANMGGGARGWYELI